jgi:hypothetical protein
MPPKSGVRGGMLCHVISSLIDISFTYVLYFSDLTIPVIKFNSLAPFLKLPALLCNIFKKIARTDRFHLEKCHPVTCNLLKYRHWLLRNDVIINFFKCQPPLFFFSKRPSYYLNDE